MVPGFIFQAFSQKRDASMTPLDTPASLKRQLQEIGKTFWPLTYGKGLDDTAVWEMIPKTIQLSDEKIAAQRAAGEDIPEDYQEWSRLMSIRVMHIACARWADQAFPVIQFASHRFAAALTATSTPKALLRDFELPWRTMAFELPDGFLALEDEAGKSLPITIVFFSRFDFQLVSDEGETRTGSPWSLLALSPTGATIFRGGQDLSRLVGNETAEFLAVDDLAVEDLESGDLVAEAGGPPLLISRIPKTTRNDRVWVVIGRLVVNACLAMSDPEAVRKIGRHPEGWTSGPGRHRLGGEPVFRTFRVGRPVDVDCRPEIDRYLSGERGTPVTVQFLVRGHWRNQACGAGRKGRKLTWISPYWKGPEDAAINVRPHVVGRGVV